jgi:phosphatidylethanolamine/phosphatidyl-N-methylethanolamine N-methyltransferase
VYHEPGGLVVELGPGTGVVTQALFDRGIAHRDLMVIESSEYFCALLARRFRGSNIALGDGMQFERYISDGARVVSIVSCLPLLNFPPSTRKALVNRALARQGDHGRFIQLSYGWSPAVSEADLKSTRKLVWRNFPPACVWVYQKSNHGGQGVDVEAPILERANKAAGCGINNIGRMK